MKRILILLAVTLMSLALFTACTSSADTMPQTSPTASAAPSAAPTTPMNTVEPNISVSPAATPDTGSVGSNTVTAMPDAAAATGSGGINTIEDAKRIAGRIDDEVEKLSEIDDAQAVVAGNIALVAIEYDDQYQGGLTDRLKDMITERVETVDKAVTTVHVTDNTEMAAAIKELERTLESASITFDELQTKLLDLGSAITGGGTPKVNQPQSDTKG